MSAGCQNKDLFPFKEIKGPLTSVLFPHAPPEDNAGNRLGQWLYANLPEPVAVPTCEA